MVTQAYPQPLRPSQGRWRRTNGLRCTRSPLCGGERATEALNNSGQGPRFTPSRGQSHARCVKAGACPAFASSLVAGSQRIAVALFSGCITGPRGIPTRRYAAPVVSSSRLPRSPHLLLLLARSPKSPLAGCEGCAVRPWLRRCLVCRGRIRPPCGNLPARVLCLARSRFSGHPRARGLLPHSEVVIEPCALPRPLSGPAVIAECRQSREPT